MVRRGGYASSTLATLLDGDQWEVLLMDAHVGMGPGGLPIVLSLLEAAPPVPTGPHGHHVGRGDAAAPPPGRQPKVAKQ